MTWIYIIVDSWHIYWYIYLGNHIEDLFCQIAFRYGLWLWNGIHSKLTYWKSSVSYCRRKFIGFLKKIVNFWVFFCSDHSWNQLKNKMLNLNKKPDLTGLRILLIIKAATANIIIGTHLYNKCMHTTTHTKISFFLKAPVGCWIGAWTEFEVLIFMEK